MKEFPNWTATFRRALIGCALVATVVAMAWIEENLRGELVLRDFERKCEAEGMPLRFAFYKPAPIPDAENIFRAPVIARFFDPHETIGAQWDGYESRTPSLFDLSKVMGDWTQGKATDFTKAFAVLGKTPVDPTKADARAGAGLVIEALKAIGPDLDALDLAIQTRPRAQIEVNANYLPPFRALRFFSRAFNLRAAAELELGQNEKACRDVLTSLQMAQGVEHFPHHLTLMMGTAMAGISLQPIWDGCAKGAWSESQLAGLQQALSKLRVLQDLPLAFAAGRAAYESGYLISTQAPWWMPRGWWKINIVRLFDLHAAPGDPKWLDPGSERVNLAVIGSSDAFLEKLGRSRSPFDWLIRHESMGSALTIHLAYGHNRFQMAGAACALERYRLARGDFPAQLSDLVPSFLDAVPRDVIDHAPLRYERLSKSRYRLYSIGLSGMDVEARSTRFASLSSTSPEGYWVWSQTVGEGNSAY